MTEMPFWLFAGQRYYPTGGMGDFIGAYTSHDGAVEVGREKDVYGYWKYDWFHVFHIQSQQIARFVRDGDAWDGDDWARL